jgi:hypothetical protein
MAHAVLARGGTALGNDLVEPAIESRQGVRHPVGAFVMGGWGGRAWRSIRLRHDFKLARQRIKAVVDGGDVFADAVLVLLGIPV